MNEKIFERGPRCARTVSRLSAAGAALFLAIGLVLGLAACSSSARRPQGASAMGHDVVIWRATSAGVIAAVEARRRGKTVLLLEATEHVGGLSASGLGATDVGNKDAIGGLARDFYRRIHEHYAKPSSWVQQARSEFKGRGHKESKDAAWTFEPKIATAVFEEMLRAQGVDVRRGVRLDLRKGIEFAPEFLKGVGPRIAAVFDTDGHRYPGRVFIDASYEGDLLPLAGVDFVLGREANKDFDETLNGVQRGRAKWHQFVRAVDPYRERGRKSSGLLPGIEAEAPGPDGSGDRRIQAYCYRICATDWAANRVAWPKPADYDEKRYELLFRNFEAGDPRRPWHPVRMPNRKTDSNNNFAVSTDYIGGNYDYASSDWTRRAEIEAEHRSWQQGLFWSLANHERVPEKIRAYFQRWGLAKDEFVDSGNWPPLLYIREGRRMRADVVMTERHVRGMTVEDDSVGLGAYGMDSHHVMRYVDEKGHVRNEGDVQVRGFDPYPISYRSLVPRRGQCSNLIVPCAVSATHIAFGSIRMEPVFMVLGHSAATAACIGLDRGVGMQDVPYSELRAQLLADGQRLDWRPEADGSDAR